MKNVTISAFYNFMKNYLSFGIDYLFPSTIHKIKKIYKFIVF